MKRRKQEEEPPAMAVEAPADMDEDEAQEEESNTLLFCQDGSGDVCKALMDRYAKSSAPHHRHLCAVAAAMRSILQEESLPLTPPAYFAAAISALSSGPSDPGAAAALAAFLAILLPLVPASSLPPPKAKDAASVLAGFLENPPKGGLATGTARSVVKSLGFLALRVDLEDWGAVELPLETLLGYSVDRRPKVRRCAQIYVEKIFRILKGSAIVKKASEAMLHMYEKYISLARECGSIELVGMHKSKKLPNPEDTEILHMLNILKALVPNLSKKVRMKIFSEVYKLLGCPFFVLTRHILKLIEALLEHIDVNFLDSESENFISALTVYISSKKNPMDTIISTSELLKNCLKKLDSTQPSRWIQTLPQIVLAIAGNLCSDANSSKDAASILKELISFHINQSIFMTAANQTCNYEHLPEATAIVSICSSFYEILSTCDLPSENILTVLSMLFLKLGEFSYFFTKDILLKLSQWAMNLDDKKGIMKHIQECIGCAVIAMGPAKVLSLLPITLHQDQLTCSNTWLIPILKKYTIGASLQFFMEHIVPLANSLRNACNKVMNVSKKKNLQSCVNGLWSLLPAFCHYPTDTSQNFESLAKLLVVVLKDNPSLHETIATALQALVNGNKSLVSGNQDTSMHVGLLTNLFAEVNDVESQNLPSYFSKKSARKNMKALASNSMDLIWALIDAYCDSPPDKRSYLKDTLKCFASVIGSANVYSLFLSLLERFDLADNSLKSENLESKAHDADTEGGDTSKREEQKETRCVVMELISAFVEAADRDLISIFFDFIRCSLLDSDDSCHGEAYFALSQILKEHSWFCVARVDEVMVLLHAIKTPLASTVMKNRLSCYQFLLVCMLKVGDCLINEENINAKAFFILNEIILILKSKKESRKLAYDVLLATSCSLKNSQSGEVESDLQRLFTMVMGYLSSPSPHIISGAVSALSLLIYSDADYCLAVPNLIPSVLVLLQNKANEVIKAALGFVKVLVSSLRSDNLTMLLADIVNGVLPWSSVSKHHFRSKVGIIIEILLRKCGLDAVEMIVSEKYKGFVRTIAQGRHTKKSTEEAVDSGKAPESTDSATRGGKKLGREDVIGQRKKHFVATSNTRIGMAKKHKGSLSLQTNQAAGKGGRNQSEDTASRTNSKFVFRKHPRDDTKKSKRENINERQKVGKRRKIRREK
ncbi:uncharacterized protein [Typha angustifolia]|uniref:uncharacterized protein isoform X1 n=1 Tax=Typha angustifolia TaxID=59011 RepID=UPI003C2BF423